MDKLIYMLIQKIVVLLIPINFIGKSLLCAGRGKKKKGEKNKAEKTRIIFSPSKRESFEN